MSKQQDPRIDMQIINPVKNISFQDVIEALYNVKVVRFDAQKNASILEDIKTGMRNVCAVVRAAPIKRSRPNEVGNDMEPFVIEEFKKLGLAAGRPATKASKIKSSGFPDIKIEARPLPIYLEVKTYSSGTYDSTQRSFYLSPTDTPKVIDDGHHLLVGFEIERQNDLYVPVAFEVVDLYDLKCDLKYEFNSDNRRLYDKQRILYKEITCND